MKADKNTVIKGVLIFMAGVAAGILYAPKSGKDTRQDIYRGANLAADKTKKSVAALNSEISKMTAKLKRKSDKLSADLTRADEILERKLEEAMAEMNADPEDLVKKQAVLKQLKKEMARREKELAS